MFADPPNAAANFQNHVVRIDADVVDQECVVAAPLRFSSFSSSVKATLMRALERVFETAFQVDL